MAEDKRNKRAGKKLSKPTDRERTTAQMILRGLEIGLSYCDILQMEAGEVLDIIIEKQNDSHEYAYIASDEDISREFGG